MTFYFSVLQYPFFIRTYEASLGELYPLRLKTLYRERLEEIDERINQFPPCFTKKLMILRNILYGKLAETQFL